jgi:ribosome biogenesis GTPase
VSVRVPRPAARRKTLNLGSTMDEVQIARLRGIGFGPVLAQRAAQLRDTLSLDAEPMRVLEVHRETLRLHSGHALLSARVLPRLGRELEEIGTALAVGDWVLAHCDVFRAWWVHAQVPPLSHIARRDGDGRCHAIVSNVDTALLVMGLDDDFNLRRLERYLALVHANAVQPVIVLTKADVVATTPGRIENCLVALRARLPMQRDVLVVNATEPSAALALSAHLQVGRTLVLLGSSGAGKSTLTNTLLGASVQDTGAVRASDHRGQHTTISRSLFQLAGGACVIDTPGVRTLRPMGNDAALSASFSDIETLRMVCRFRDCRHGAEPGCAVRASVDADRLRNHHKLLREGQRDAMSALRRREQRSEWKARDREGLARLRHKRGES